MGFKWAWACSQNAVNDVIGPFLNYDQHVLLLVGTSTFRGIVLIYNRSNIHNECCLFSTADLILNNPARLTRFTVDVCSEKAESTSSPRLTKRECSRS